MEGKHIVETLDQLRNIRIVQDAVLMEYINEIQGLPNHERRKAPVEVGIQQGHGALVTMHEEHGERKVTRLGEFHKSGNGFDLHWVASMSVLQDMDTYVRRHIV